MVIGLNRISQSCEPRFDHHIYIHLLRYNAAYHTKCLHREMLELCTCFLTTGARSPCHEPGDVCDRNTPVFFLKTTRIPSTMPRVMSIPPQKCITNKTLYYTTLAQAENQIVMHTNSCEATCNIT